MRRSRNARYVFESLERKLHPSTLAVAPITADVSTVIVSGSQGYGYSTTGTASDPTTLVDLSSSDAPSYTAPLTDYLILDPGTDSTAGTGDATSTDDTSLIGDGPMPIVPSTNPAGPVVSG